MKRIGISAIFLIFLAACSHIPTQNFSYNPAPLPDQQVKKIGGVLAVRTLQEGRPPRHFTPPVGKPFLLYIPLIPYVTLPYERLEESFAMTHGGEKLNLPDAMSRAMARDLQASGLFDRVVHVGDGALPDDTDYVLTGTLRSTRHTTSMTSYLLGMPGVLLWLAPIPNAKDTATVVLDLEMSDLFGQSLWQHTIDESSFVLYTLWNSGDAVPVTHSVGVHHYGSNQKGIDGNSILARHANALRNGMIKAKVALVKSLMPSE